MMTGDNSVPCIVVIDDNEEILSFLDEILRNSGYRSLTECSGKQGLEVLLRESPNLVVLDREMPGMTGYDVAGAIREQWPEMPIILYTGLPFDISPDRQQLFTGIVGKTNCVELLNLIAITTQRIRKKPCI